MTPRMAPIVAAALTSLVIGVPALADAADAAPAGAGRLVADELPGPTAVAPDILAATTAPAAKTSAPGVAPARVAPPTRTARKSVAKRGPAQTTGPKKKPGTLKTTQHKTPQKAAKQNPRTVVPRQPAPRRIAVKPLVTKVTTSPRPPATAPTATRLQPQARKIKPPKGTPSPTPSPSPTPTPTPTPLNPPPAPGLVLDWRDDFDGPAGSALDPAHWRYELGGSGRGNGNLEYTTNRPENVSLDGSGNLVLTARSDNVAGLTCWYGPCRYTSGRVTSQDRRTATYGRVEARMKLPEGKGLWPAFWMLGANYPLVDHPMCGEIDIMELVGDEPGRVWSSVHGPGYTLSGLTAKYDLPAGQTYHDAFHTFALDWSPSELVFSVDGNVYHRVPRSAIGDNPWVFDQPFFVILNLTVGGSWGGEPAATTVFPAQMVIDHVAVYSAG